MRGCRWTLVAAFLFLQYRAQGQSVLLAGTPRGPDTVALGFERVLNTFTWNGNLGLAVGDSNTSLIVGQILHSRLIRSDPVAIQGEYDGYVGFRSGITGGWDFLAKTSSLVVSDNQSIDLSKLAQHRGLIGLGYNFSPWNFAALGGYEIDNQESEQDQGPALDASIVGSGLQFQQIKAGIRTDWTKSFLGKRSPEQQDALVSMQSDFGGGDSDSLAVHYSRQRREFYTAADQGVETLYAVNHNIFRRDAVSYDVSNRLAYHMNQSTSIVIRGTLQNRVIDRGFVYKDFLEPSSITLDTRIQELLFGGSASLSAQMFDWLTGDLGMSFEERDERFAVANEEGVPLSVVQSQEESAKTLEYTSQRTSLWGIIVSDFSASDRLKLNGSASILRYDTPDSLNTDDRDELLLAVSLRESHRFNQYLSVALEANVTLNHLVYLDRLQSANNNWNRVLSLSPIISLKPTPWLSSDNTGEVVANYTVYDFEEQVASVKSFSFREASWSDSTVVTLSPRVDFAFLGTLRAYERGILKWKDFKEKPLDYFVEKSVWPQLFYRAFTDMLVSFGYRYFSQDQYAYDGTARSLSHTIATTGPTVGVQWVGVNGTNVSVNGWRETSTSDFGTPSYVSNLSLSVNLMF